MVITSGSKHKIPIQLKSAQFKYALIYIIITLLVLIVLNLYSSQRSQEIFYNSKASSMLEKCRLASNEISSLHVLNYSTVENALIDLTDSPVTRIIVTDQNCRIIFDTNLSADLPSTYALFPEIITALDGKDVFTWNYYNRSMRSKAAVPVYSYGTLVACVYLMEIDSEQGILINSLQTNIFTITLVLEIAVILFSIWFSTVYTGRLRKIMASIRTVRTGDYTHKLDVGGNDELTVLGDEFNDLIARLQVSEKKRSQFVSDASHELKTPLASIKLLSDTILQNQMDNSTIKEFVEDIGQEAERLNRMSQKLLTLSRIESQSDGNCEIVYISPTVERVVRMLSVIADESKIQISCDLRSDNSILILEDDLYQIIFNLVENGIKYNRRGGSLRICLDRNDDHAVIMIEDTGMGISEEALDHIFERFYRVDKARSRSTGGSGLGLAIVKNLVERNGGTIHVESQVGIGTRFLVMFPVFDLEEENP